jgi:hypothetical protein
VNEISKTCVIIHLSSERTAEDIPDTGRIISTE